MGTHNRLLRLGDRVYLELIAVDPAAPSLARPRWFDLDRPHVREAAARSPFLLTWVVRTDDIAAATERAPILGDVLPLARGPYRWRITVPADGARRFDGVLPSLIQWDGDAHPADALPDAGCALAGISLAHPDAGAINEIFKLIGLAEPISVAAGPASISARIRHSTGVSAIA